MHQYTLRTYQNSDAAQLCTLFDQFQDELVQLDPLHRLQRQVGYGAATLAQTLDMIAHHESIWYVVVVEDQIVAFAVALIQRPTSQEGLSLIPSSRGHLIELYVLPSHRGQGIGTQLVQSIEQYCFQQGCDVVRIEVFAPNHSARGLYAKLGYTERDISLIKPIASLEHL